MADRAVGNRELARSGGDAGVARGGFKGAQGVEWQVSSIHHLKIVIGCKLF